MSPTQRSLALLKKQGYHCAIVERWNPYARVRQDLFSFADLIAFRPGQPGSMLVQTTTASNAAARRAKIHKNVTALEWLMAGNWIRLDKWAARGSRGSRKVWTAESEYITIDSFKHFKEV
jgi:hypothetical protein